MKAGKEDRRRQLAQVSGLGLGLEVAVVEQAALDSAESRVGSDSADFLLFE